MAKAELTVGNVVIGFVVVGLALAFLGWKTDRQRLVSTVPVAAAGSPEAGGTYEVHTVKLASVTIKSEATLVSEALTEWLQANRGKRIISVLRCSGQSGSALVILAIREG